MTILSPHAEAAADALSHVPSIKALNALIHVCNDNALALSCILRSVRTLPSRRSLAVLLHVAVTELKIEQRSHYVDAGMELSFEFTSSAEQRAAVSLSSSSSSLLLTPSSSSSSLSSSSGSVSRPLLKTSQGDEVAVDAEQLVRELFRQFGDAPEIPEKRIFFADTLARLAPAVDDKTARMLVDWLHSDTNLYVRKACASALGSVRVESTQQALIIKALLDCIAVENSKEW
jgi:hypothetical protein